MAARRLVAGGRLTVTRGIQWLFSIGLRCTHPAAGRAAAFDPHADAVEIPRLGGVGLPRPGRWTSRRPRPLRCDAGSAPVHAHGRSPTLLGACRPAAGTAVQRAREAAPGGA